MKLLFVFLLSLPLSEASIKDNKEVVQKFYNMAFNQHLPRQAAELFIGHPYIQHNPHAPDGKEAFINFFETFYKTHKEAKVEIKRLVAEEDLVVVHTLSKLSPEDNGNAVIDIFRLKEGKIVEHWDVIQGIPTKSMNTNTMF